MKRNSVSHNLKQITTLIYFFILIFPFGCTQPPSEEKIKTAIIEYKKNTNENYLSFDGTVEIIQIGDYNSERKYWPVKAKITGTIKGFSYQGGRAHTSFTDDYIIYLDDYGNPKAEENYR